MNYHLCIIYDGIANSVFESQLLIPFANRIAQEPNSTGLLISFERSMPEKKYLDLVAAYAQIKLVVLKKIPFFGSISLRYAAYQLERAITRYSFSSVQARGPLAGWIAGHTKALAVIPTIVQARGLAAQEYEYANRYEIPRYTPLRRALGTSGLSLPLMMPARHSLGEVGSYFLSATKKIISNHIHALRTRQYESIERWCYGTYARKTNVTIHAVSDALKHYVIEKFNAPEKKISVEIYDIPAEIPFAQRTSWRHDIRMQLAIAPSSYVYVYSGSAKAWQCPRETVAYVAEKYAQDKKTFFLVLTQEHSVFQALCQEYKLPQESYCITTVSAQDIYRYLAAADAGMLLRESHPINWVSRPTKALEYQALGLTIVHNDTIQMLAQDYPAAQRTP